MNDRESFIQNFLDTEGAALPDHPNANVRVTTSLIGAIYDLQQQVVDLKEQVDDLSKTVVHLRNS